MHMHTHRHILEHGMHSIIISWLNESIMKSEKVCDVLLVFLPPVLQDLGFVGEMLLNIDHNMVSSITFSVSEWGSHRIIRSTLFRLYPGWGGLFWTWKTFSHYWYHYIKINTQQFIVLVLLAAKKNHFNTFILGYVEAQMCFLYACVNTLWFRS